MDQQRIHRARMQGILRNSNYGIGEAASGLGQETFRLFCECGTTGCREKIEVERSEYERVRSHPLRLFMATHHANPEIEKPVEMHPGFMVVEEPEEVQAALTDYVRR